MTGIQGNPQHQLERLAGTILTPGGWVRGTVEYGTRITAVRGEPVAVPEPGEPLILPGFMDLHVHGGGGADLMGGPDALATLTRTHARHGTTSLLATTVSAGREDLERVADEVGRAVRQRTPGCARVLGLHLEGPFINPARLGAQPDTVRTGTLAEILALRERAPIAIVTLAPELDGHLDLIAALAGLGVVVQIGHTQGDYRVGVAALRAGARSFTHLFNAMTGMHHREPGMVAAAMAHAQYAEVIPDLLHVHPGVILAALRAIPGLYGVTDATAGAGMPDGTYRLGSQSVIKHQDGVRLADGTLAGSTLTMDQALRNLVAIGLPLAEASRRLSAGPARMLGVTDRGRIAVDGWADLVVLDADLRLQSVILEGEILTGEA